MEVDVDRAPDANSFAVKLVEDGQVCDYIEDTKHHKIAELEDGSRPIVDSLEAPLLQLAQDDCGSTCHNEDSFSDDTKAILEDDTGRLGPLWFRKFIYTEYHHICERHQKAVTDASKDGVRLKFFCMECARGPLCKFGVNAKHKAHRLLQQRIASQCISVKCDDIKKLAPDIDFSFVGEWSINHASIYYLRSRPQTKYPKGRKNHLCIQCSRLMETRRMEKKSIFCSLECKLIVIFQDPSSEYTFNLCKIEAQPDTVVEATTMIEVERPITSTTRPTLNVYKINRRYPRRPQRAPFF